MHMSADIEEKDTYNMTLVEFTLLCTEHLQNVKRLQPVRIAAIRDGRIVQLAHVVRGMNTIVWYQFVLDNTKGSSHQDHHLLYHFSFGTTVSAFTHDPQATLAAESEIALRASSRDDLLPAAAAAMRNGNSPFAHNEKFTWFDVACDDYETLFDVKKFVLRKASGSIIATNIKKQSFRKLLKLKPTASFVTAQPAAASSPDTDPIAAGSSSTAAAAVAAAAAGVTTLPEPATKKRR